MGMSKKLNVISLYSILAVFAMCVPSVEDLVSKNTCDWICNAENGDIDSNELEGKISQGELIRLEISYKQRVHVSCGSANDTLDLNNKTEDAGLWFKMAPTSMGKIAFLSSTILGEIFTGRIFFKSSKAMYVSCIFKPITSPTTNHCSQFAFHTAQSVMYFVNEIANYSKRNYNFLTLIKTEKQTHITFDVSSLEASSCHDHTPYDGKKLTLNDTWLVVSVLISIIIVLYSPAILLVFRPSKVTVQLTEKTRENREGARFPVHGDDVNEERLNPPIQVELEGEDSEENFENDGGYEADMSPYGVTETLDCDNILMDTQSEMVGAPQRTSMSNPSEKQIVNVRTWFTLGQFALTGLRPQVLSHPLIARKAQTSENSKTRCSSPRVSPSEIAVPYASAESLTDGEQTQTSENSGTRCSSPRVSPSEIAASSVPYASAESLTDGEQTQPSENSGTRCSSPRVSPSEIAGSDNGRGENDSRTSVTVVNISETPDHRGSRMENQIVSHEGNGNCISMIIVGGPSPVSISSWIGNKLFLSSNGNQCHKLKMLVKFIIISFLPILLLTGFGDLLLILLNIDQGIAMYLPNHYLTSSVFKVSHPGLIFLAVFSLVCYTIRSLFVYDIISECSIWKSCFVHSRHPLVFYRLRCLFWPCNECKNSPPECPKKIEVPDNISHNLEELTGMFIKYWNFLCHCLVEYLPTVANKMDLRVKIVSIMLVILFVTILAVFRPFLLLVSSLIFLSLLLFTPLVDILLSSPLVCLCHGRMRVFKDKRPFKCLEFLLTCFSLIWLAFYSVRGAVVVEIASAGFLNMLNDRPEKLLQSVNIIALACFYGFCSSSCFTARYLELVKELFNSYSKKFKELEEKGEGGKLSNFKQGKHNKLIPTDLFEYACEHQLIKMPVRNSVAMMLLEPVVLLLLFLFVHPLIHLPRSYSASIGTAVIGVLTAYSYFNNRKETPKFNEGDIDTVVNEFIKRQQ